LSAKPQSKPARSATAEPTTRDLLARLAALEGRLDLLESVPSVRRELEKHRLDAARERQDREHRERAEREREAAAPARQQRVAEWAAERLARIPDATERLADVWADYSATMKARNTPRLERLEDADALEASLVAIGIEVGDVPVNPMGHTRGIVGARLLLEGEDVESAVASAAWAAQAAADERELDRAARRTQVELEREALERKRRRDEALIGNR